MSFPAEAHTLSIRGALTVLGMLSAGFLQTTDVSSAQFEVSLSYITLTYVSHYFKKTQIKTPATQEEM